MVLKGCKLRVQSREQNVKSTVDTFFEMFAIFLEIIKYDSSCFFFMREVAA